LAVGHCVGSSQDLPQLRVPYFRQVSVSQAFANAINGPATAFVNIIRLLKHAVIDKAFKLVSPQDSKPVHQ
jgi:hypothetical protein